MLADQALNGVVQQIRDEHWDQPVPEGFHHLQTDRRPSLREIVNDHAYDEAWVPDMLAGKTMDEVGRDKFDGDLLGDDPRAAFAALVERGMAAARQVDDLERTAHLSFGDYTVRQYFQQINGFRGLRANDIARVIGVDHRLRDELVQGLWDEIAPQAEFLRRIGVFPPEVPVAPDAPLQDRLLGITGRDPRAGLSGQG